MPRHSITAQLATFAEYRAQPDFGCWVDHDFNSWLLAPCSTYRGADTVQRANWREMCAELDRINPDGDTDEPESDYRILRFGHWVDGWCEIAIVRPGSKCAEYAAGLVDALESYPVLSDESLSQLERDEAAESWENYGADDMRRAIRDKFREVAPSVVEFLADNATNEQLREFMEELYPNEPYFFDGGGCNFPINRAVDNLGRDELAAFARKVRA